MNSQKANLQSNQAQQRDLDRPAQQKDDVAQRADVQADKFPAQDKNLARDRDIGAKDSAKWVDSSAKCGAQDAKDQHAGAQNLPGQSAQAGIGKSQAYQGAQADVAGKNSSNSAAQDNKPSKKI